MGTWELDPFDDTSWDDAGKTYLNAVDQAFGAGGVISNGKPAHAVYLIHKLIANARSTVRVFTGNLRRIHGTMPAWANPHVVEAVRTFLRRPGRSGPVPT